MASNNKGSLLHAALGNATEGDKKEANSLVAPVLIPGEEVSHVYKVGVRDQAVFTNKRLIVVDKQGISGKRIQLESYPYKTFQNWTMSTAGKFDIDSELVITTAGGGLPLRLNFGKKVNLSSIYQAVSLHVLSS